MWIQSGVSGAITLILLLLMTTSTPSRSLADSQLMTSNSEESVQSDVVNTKWSFLSLNLWSGNEPHDMADDSNDGSKSSSSDSEESVQSDVVNTKWSLTLNLWRGNGPASDEQKMMNLDENVPTEVSLGRKLRIYYAMLGDNKKQ